MIQDYNKFLPGVSGALRAGGGACMKLADVVTGLLINFNVKRLEEGFHRFKL